MLKRKNKIYLKPFAAVCMLTLSACSSDEALPVPDNPADKTPIELTVGVVGDSPGGTRAATRSVVTTDRPYGQDAQVFGAATNLYMIMKSDNGAGSGTKYSRTMGTVAASSTTVTLTGDYLRYWEDSYSRNSKLSVYSACVPGQSTALTIGGSSAYNSNTWGDDAIATTIAWPMFSGTVANQTASFLTAQDLCFSNNVSDLDTDNRISYVTNKFTTGNMIYYHALTWVTFKIKKGNGFKTGDAFAFTNSNENIVLKGFNTSGTFTITEGEFTSTSSSDINQLALTDHRNETSPAYEYVLDGYLVPGSVLEGTDLDQVYFTIDDNTYHLTKNQLQTALASEKLSDNTTTALTDDHKMRPGVHYVFEMTVGKKMMDKLTAKVVDWETVNADEVTPTNARITVSLLDNGTQQTGNPATFDLYRSTNTNEGTIDDDWVSYAWTTGYTLTNNKADLLQNATAGEYTAYNDKSDPSTAWYWPNNKTFYHFRTVKPTSHAVTEDTDNGDYLSLSRAASYTDVCWGAPFKSTDGKLTYECDTYGFDGSASHQISKAIGPTTGTINMEMFHMMSDVTIQLSTSAGSDAVTLTGATINLTNTYPSGKVLMGNGRVIPTESVSDVNATVDGSYKVEHYGFIPQALTGVVLTITTSDHNQYIINMDEVKATTVGNNLIANPYTLSDGKYTINRWYPNYQYTYTFKLTKTGIANMTATLANWETVTAGDDNVQIK